MGLFITKLLDTISLNKSKETKILLLGLDGAGKTTLVYKLKLGQFISTVPTIGFNVEKVEYKNLNMTMWDIGGQKTIRNLWRYYYPQTNAIVFLIDSCDKERLELAKEELYNLLDDEELRDSKLLVFANKQDMGIMSVSEIMNGLGLHKVKRPWHIQGCSALTGDGIQEGFDWLSEQFAKNK
jgi:small GTP-binding protein